MTPAVEAQRLNLRTTTEVLVCLFWRNVCLDLQPIFLIGSFFGAKLYMLFIYFGY